MKTFLLEVHTIVNLHVLQVNEYFVAHNSCDNVQLVGDAARDMGICKRRSFWKSFYCGCLSPSLHRPPKTLKSHQCMYDLLNGCFLKKSMTKKKAIFWTSGFFCFPEARGRINVPWWPWAVLDFGSRTGGNNSCCYLCQSFGKGLSLPLHLSAFGPWSWIQCRNRVLFLEHQRQTLWCRLAAIIFCINSEDTFMLMQEAIKEIDWRLVAIKSNQANEKIYLISFHHKGSPVTWCRVDHSHTE